MKSNAQPPDDGDISLADKIRKMNAVMAFCSDDIRYDLQRNLLQAVESLMRTNPLNLYLSASFKEMAETCIRGYDGRGRLHIGLRQAAGKASHEGVNIWTFQSLKMRFNSHNPAEKYMIDRALAKRSDEGKLILTAWGKFVLDYMDKRGRENIPGYGKNLPTLVVEN